MVTTKWVRQLTAGALLAGLSTVSSAAVLFQQGLNEVDNLGFFSNIDNDLSADNFVLGGSATLQSISWFGMYDYDDAGLSDLFNIEILDLGGTSLNSNIGVSATSKVDTGFTDAYGSAIYQYSLDLPALELEAGEYLLSISNQNDIYSNWFWADSLDGDGITYSLLGGNDIWSPENWGVDMAFTLNGETATVPVPEPSTWLLLSLGVAALAWRRRQA